LDLRISGQTDYRSERTIAINKQLPVLSSIINKASLMIDPKQIDDIPHHWFSLQIEKAISKTQLQKYGFSIGVVLFLFIIWIIRLNHEVKLHKQLERKEHRRNKILDMLMNHQSLQAILSTLCVDVDALDSNIACSILLVSSDGKHLLHGAAPHLPDFYCLAIDGVLIGPNVGSCGDSAYRETPVYAADILTHPNWFGFRDLVIKLPYRACWSRPIFSSAGELLGTFAIYHRKAKLPNSKSLEMIEAAGQLAGNAIEQSRQSMQLKQAAKVYSNSLEGIYITDKNGHIIDLNDAFLHVSGYSRDELLGQHSRLFRSGVHDDKFYRQMWHKLLTEGVWSGEIWNKYKDRDNSPGWHSISVLRNDNNEIERFIAITTDITELKHSQQRLEQFAYYDNLTNLPNRLLLTDRLNQMILHSHREHKNLAVGFIDLDGFKDINDNYGHGVGDAFLLAISRKMKTVIRETDTLGRLGGDEFIVLLDQQENQKSFLNPIKKIIDVCNSFILIEKVNLKVSASIGVRYFEGKSNVNVDASTLLLQADQAMYIAKQSGKNRYHLFDDEADQISNTRERSIDNVSIALKNNDFLLYYQPKVNMRTGELLGVEALVRWNHAQKGILLPDQFLPMIANHPVSIELGNRVIQQALSQIDQWQTRGINIPVSINVDAKQIYYYSFVDSLKSAIAAYPNFQQGSLEIEILETSALTDPEQAALIMFECQKLGVKFSLDDFGVGYSSLNYLKSLPIEIIKIDRSFTKDIIQNLDDLAIVDVVISLGGFMERKVIAEGVESIEIGEMLLKHGCDYGQGYVIAMPMPADDIIAWKEVWSPDPAWQNVIRS
jgi:diguanylate cyclase (GGDEF)-like protein/PAS domain S-box-containing protein